jgi:hypothetical protein
VVSQTTHTLILILFILPNLRPRDAKVMRTNREMDLTACIGRGQLGLSTTVNYEAWLAVIHHDKKT